MPAPASSSPSATHSVCHSNSFARTRRRLVLFALFLAFAFGLNPAQGAGEPFELLFAGTGSGTPYAGLTLGSDGSFYGTVGVEGPVSTGGRVFKVTPAGEVTILSAFKSEEQGYLPYGVLLEGSDGNFYGTTYRGGSGKFGTMFRVTPSGEHTVLHSFDKNSGAFPYGGLIEGIDGNFYGTTSEGGSNEVGTIYRITSSGEHILLHSFDPEQGAYPRGELLLASDGNLYGTAYLGGEEARGTIYKLDSSGEFSVLHSFGVLDGERPGAGLVEGSDGIFYGTTQLGGVHSAGTIFRITSAGEHTVLHSFSGADGHTPDARLVEATDGSLYGTASLGGTGNRGLVFRITKAGEFSVVHSFDGMPGFNPRSPLVIGTDGSFYGTTASGGGSNRGTIYKISSAGAHITLHAFDFVQGEDPLGKLLEGTDGNFYGTTGGGPTKQGTIFRVTPAGVHTVLHSFNGTDGGGPLAGLVEGSDGIFYGTTRYGGVNSRGTVYKFSESEGLTVLHSFDDVQGAEPISALVIGSDGNLYGTTSIGGPGLTGTFFKVTPNGVHTVLHAFSVLEGVVPLRPVIASDGNFYGVTIFGGVNNGGTFYKLTPAGMLTILHSFGRETGVSPSGDLIEGADGNFYGITTSGGAANKGTFYKITPAGEHTALHSFNGTTEGVGGVAGVVQGPDGNFYGTTLLGGVNGQGTIYRITPNGMHSILHSFGRAAAEPSRSASIFGSDGKLYGTAGPMALWRLTLPVPPEVELAAESPVTAITPNTATLHGSVNPGGGTVAAQFEYGLTDSLGQVAPVTLSPSNGTIPQSVSASLSGLAAHSTYYYRLAATNLEGTASTGIQTFTTTNSTPSAPDGSVNARSGTRQTISLDFPLTDLDGDAVTMTNITAGENVTINAVNGRSVQFTPDLNFVGVTTLTYTVTDGFGGSATGTITLLVELSSDATLSSLSIDGATLAPTFSPTITSYSATVGNATEAVSVTAVKGFVAASVGQTPANPVALGVGDNTITLTVTAQDGTTSNAYSITVKRTAPDKAKPVVKITSPGSSVTGPFTISGTVTEAIGLKLFVIRFNGSELALDSPLAAESGTSMPWSISNVQPENGPNVVEAEAIDYNGNRSVAKKVVSYINPDLAALAGTYPALIKPAGAASLEQSGLVTIRLQPNGRFTGKATLGSVSVPFKGILENDGTARFQPSLSSSMALSTRKPARTLGTLRLSVSDDTGMSGRVSDSNDTTVANFAGQVAPFGERNPVAAELLNLPAGANPSKGVYNLIFPAKAQTPARPLSDYPQGTGIGNLTLKKNGAVSTVLNLADGTSSRISGILRKDQSVAIYKPLYKKLGSIAGELTFDPAAADSDVTGSDWLWLRPEVPSAKHYPQGWSHGLKIDVIGTKYATPASLDFGQGSEDAANGNAILQFTGGLLTGAPLERFVSIHPTTGAVKLTITAAADTKLRLATKTGSLTGSFPHTDGTKPAFSATILDKGSNKGGYGFFLSKPASGATGQSGSVILTPAGP